MEFIYHGISTYDTTGALARAGEVTKRKSWASALTRQAPFATTAVEYVPLSCDISGAWGPATERFFNDAIDHINNERDIDFFRWRRGKIKTVRPWHKRVPVVSCYWADSSVCVL